MSLKHITEQWSVADGWQQGRGAWGGLTITAMAEIVAAHESTDRVLRTISTQILEPVVVGDYTMTAKCLRQGSAMSTWEVDISPHAFKDDSTNLGSVARAQIITGSRRNIEITPPLKEWGSAVMPEVATAEECMIIPLGPPVAPTFTQRLEYRPISPLPTMGESDTALGWVRIPSATKPGSIWTAAELMGIIDAWWPVSYSIMKEMRPMATVAFSAHLLIDPETIESVKGERAPLLHEATISSAFDGFTSELRRLWTADGRLVAENLQSIVVIK